MFSFHFLTKQPILNFKILFWGFCVLFFYIDRMFENLSEIHQYVKIFFIERRFQSVSFAQLTSISNENTVRRNILLV